MNNYFTSLEKLKEKNEIKEEKNEIEIQELNKFPKQSDLIKKQQEMIQQEKEKFNNLKESEQKLEIDVEKEYQNVIDVILNDLMQFKTQGEVIFFSNRKIHLKILGIVYLKNIIIL